jgi:hypothetical protein
MVNDHWFKNEGLRCHLSNYCFKKMSNLNCRMIAKKVGNLRVAFKKTIAD